MATVKVYFVQDASKVQKYLKSKEREEHPQSEYMVSLDSLKADFVREQKKGRSSGNELIHIMQNFSPEESRKLTPEQVHAMGVALVERFAPGHQYVVQTHTDQPHYHNHIALNPVLGETGRRIQNKKRHLQTLRELSNEISIENGLSIIPGGTDRRRTGFSDKIQRIDRARGQSYILDLAGKANFARHHASGFDDYVALLNAFDVQVRIEPENITYYYPGKNQGKRGRNLDPRLDKAGLEKQFETNRVRLLALPDRRAALSELIATYRTPPRALEGIEPPKREPLISKRAEGVTRPRADELTQSIVPIEEVQRAKMQSILGYCAREKIPLARAEDGRTTLCGREYVEVSDYTWTNHRNKTQGNAIDFVAAHREVGFLKAVSILNNNPKLLLLEQYVGEAKKPYQSFYVPKGDGAPRAKAVAHLARWLGHPSNHRVYGELLKQQRVHVSRGGLIRLFGSQSDEGALEYVPQVGGDYEARRRGSPGSAFFASHPRKASELHLYLDPKTFLRRSPDLYVAPKSAQAALLVLLAPMLKPVHETIARLDALERVLVIGGDGAARATDRDVLTFFDSLKDSLDPFHVETRLTWEPPALSLSARALDRGYGLEREIRFP